ncbi:hypothetical protein FS837_011732 [Tulasnella sp. UAMH 9824]|nr:hypothetical protein FS837_011732 [Tulasnella sp. UAMH 9824]
MPLAEGGIRCSSSGCSNLLDRGYWLDEPRRVVFASASTPNSETIPDDAFWIFGVMYKCYLCAGGDTRYYESWDPRLLDCLPALLKAEFPAVERDGRLIALHHVVPAEHRVQSCSSLPKTLHIEEPDVATSVSSNAPPSIATSLGGSHANLSVASAAASQLPGKDGPLATVETPALIQASSSSSIHSPSPTLRHQGKNSCPEASAASSSSANLTSRSPPATFRSGGKVHPRRATTPPLEETSPTFSRELECLSSASNNTPLAQTKIRKPPTSPSTSHSTGPPQPLDSQKKRGKRSTTKDDTSSSIIIPVPTLAAPKGIPTSTPSTIHPVTSAFPILDYTKLRPSPAAPRGASEPEPPVDRPSTSASTATTPLTTPPPDKEDVPYKPGGPRAPRRCSKCDMQGCRGGYRVKLCTNRCVGCGQAGCDKPHRSKRNLCVVPSAGWSEVKGGRRPDGELTAIESSRSRSVRSDSNFEGDDAEIEAQLGVDVEDSEDCDGIALDYE